MDTKVTNSAGFPVDRTYWNLDIDNELLCIDVRQETHDVKTFTFVSRAGKHQPVSISLLTSKRVMAWRRDATALLRRR